MRRRSPGENALRAGVPLCSPAPPPPSRCLDICQEWQAWTQEGKGAFSFTFRSRSSNSTPASLCHGREHRPELSQEFKVEFSLRLHTCDVLLDSLFNQAETVEKMNSRFVVRKFKTSECTKRALGKSFGSGIRRTREERLPAPGCH